MQYRLIYDVLNDQPPWLGLAISTLWLAGALACFLEILERAGGRRLSPAANSRRSFETLPLIWVTIILIWTASTGTVLAWLTYEGFIEQRQCQEWTRSGDYEVSEGTITDYEFRKGGARFRLGDLYFDLMDHSGSFTGRFNIDGTEKFSLAAGVRVRLTHHGSFILRVEFAQRDFSRVSDRGSGS